MCHNPVTTVRYNSDTTSLQHSFATPLKLRYTTPLQQCSNTVTTVHIGTVHYNTASKVR